MGEVAQISTRARESQIQLRGVAVRVNSSAALNFYRNALLNRETRRSGNLISVGRRGQETVTVESAKVRRLPLSAGAFGLEFPDPAALATVVAGIGLHAPETFSAGRRTVERDTFTFTAPDGTAVELSAPTAGGGTCTLDPDAYIVEHITPAGRASLAPESDRASLPAPVLTHANLSVTDVRATAHYYIENFGFTIVTERYGQVVLQSGRQQLTLSTVKKGFVGLAGLALMVPTVADLDALAGRLARSGHKVAVSGSHIYCVDPGGTRLTITNED